MLSEGLLDEVKRKHNRTTTLEDLFYCANARFDLVALLNDGMQDITVRAKYQDIATLLFSDCLSSSLDPSGMRRRSSLIPDEPLKNIQYHKYFRKEFLLRCETMSFLNGDLKLKVLQIREKFTNDEFLDNDATDDTIQMENVFQRKRTLGRVKQNSLEQSNPKGDKVSEGEEASSTFGDESKANNSQ